MNSFVTCRLRWSQRAPNGFLPGMGCEPLWQVMRLAGKPHGVTPEMPE